MPKLQNRFLLNHRWTCLKVLYSSHYGPNPHMEILQGLKGLLAGKPAIPLVVGDTILLMGLNQPLDRAEWGAVVAWLMQQPQVVFVHRVTGTWESI